VEVWEGGQRLGRVGEQAEGQAQHGGTNGDGGGRCVLGRAQGRDSRGGVIGQERRKQLRLSVVSTGATAWVPRRLATCGGAPASGWRCARVRVRYGRVSPA
jgi:hypothetical protein